MLNHIEDEPQPKKQNTSKESSSSKTVIPDLMKCPSCNEIYYDPKMYLCGHTVCKVKQHYLIPMGFRGIYHVQIHFPLLITYLNY